MQKIIREVSWYEKNSDAFVGRCILPEESILELRRLFNLGDDDPMVYSYPVSDFHVNYLQQCIEHKIDLKQYDYFVESFSVDEGVISVLS